MAPRSCTRSCRHRDRVGLDPERAPGRARTYVSASPATGAADDDRAVEVDVSRGQGECRGCVIGVEIPEGIRDVVDNKLDRDCVSYGRFAFKHAAEQNHRSEHSRGAIERSRGGRTAAARICGIAHSQSSGAEQNGPGRWLRVPGSRHALSMLTKCPVFATPVPRHHVERRAPDGSRLVMDRATSERFVVYLPRRVAEFGAGHRAGLWYLRSVTEVGDHATQRGLPVGSCRRAGTASRQLAGRPRAPALYRPACPCLLVMIQRDIRAVRKAHKWLVFRSALRSTRRRASVAVLDPTSLQRDEA